MQWLVKSDPDTYGWPELEKEGVARWDGVRNPEARNHLAEMRPGEGVLIYHSGADKAVVGTARVTKPAYPEPGADDPPLAKTTFRIGHMGDHTVKGLEARLEVFDRVLRRL